MLSNMTRENIELYSIVLEFKMKSTCILHTQRLWVERTSKIKFFISTFLKIVLRPFPNMSVINKQKERVTQGIS